MKRIIICSDGTWQSPESDNPTHVLRVARAITPEDLQGNKQVVFYDWGVGTEGDRVRGGATGAGLDKNIMDTYRFIVHNYEEGDALFFFGFSRGAYTVRSLAGLIRNAGILRREHAELIPKAYELYRQRSADSKPFKEKSTEFRQLYAVADITRICFIGVWDTVGALGIPAPFLGTLGTTRYLFHDTEPSSIIDCARHAVSIDETREDFEPTLWSHKPSVDLKQVWFAGVHTDIGGGYADHRLGDYAGKWLLDEACQCGLSCAPHLETQMHPDHSGPQHNEYRGFYRALRRSRVREVQPLLHQSVKARWDDPSVDYTSPALKQLLARVGDDWQRIHLAS